VDRDTLPEGFMDGFTERVVEVGLTAEDESEAVDRIIAIVHEHFNIVEDGGRQILGLVNSQQEGLAFFFIKVKDLGLDGIEHPGLTAFRLHTEDVAELAVKFHNADGGQADVLHVVEVRVEGFGKTAQRKGFPHARASSKNTNSSGVLQIVKTVEHLLEVQG
jgi:hypothetical protein